jgi:oxalate decarboxylase
VSIKNKGEKKMSDPNKEIELIESPSRRSFLGRITIFMPPNRARTMDFNANDVGYVPRVAGHYIENTGNTDLVFLEMFKTDQYVDISMNNWIRRLPPELVTSRLNIDEATIKKIPVENQAMIAG